MENQQVFTIIVILIAVSTGLSSYLLYRVEKLQKRINVLEKLFNEILNKANAIKAISKKSYEKPRKRYIVFKILSERPLQFNQVEKLLKSAMKTVYGETGLAGSRLYLAIYDHVSHIGVVRVTAEWKDKTIILMSLIRELEGSKILIIPLRTTGSIKRAREVIRELA